MSDLIGKHAVVTGGGTGVGASIALALAHAGATVTVTGRSKAALVAVAEQSALISAVTCDVTDPVSVKALFCRISQDHGKADIVIANAGVAESIPFTQMDIESWKRMIDVNLTGAFLTMQAGLIGMEDAKWGRIICIGSVAGLKGYAYVAGYCAAKHGVIGLTKSIAQEVAKSGITVNAICPGYTETPMLERTLENIMSKTGRSRDDAAKALLRQNPSGRFVQPEEVAQTVLFLCGPNSASITGQAISVSGGEV
tara:strand:- start:24142 stop:24903 length:762 start_codon:yes stop_codon:yes gene_type:complete